MQGLENSKRRASATEHRQGRRSGPRPDLTHGETQRRLSVPLLLAGRDLQKIERGAEGTESVGEFVFHEFLVVKAVRIALIACFSHSKTELPGPTFSNAMRQADA